MLDGTYPVRLSLDTQERFECVADKDINELEPHKTIWLGNIRDDLKEKAEESDFHPLAEQIAVSRI